LPYLGFTIPANAYAELVVHHVVQLCITIALIAVMGRGSLRPRVDCVLLVGELCSVTHFNALQQVTLLVFGVFYGLLFFKHRSLVGPIVAHGMLNVVIVSSGVLLSLVS